MPCKQGTRQAIEEGKKYYAEQRKHDPHRELWVSLVKRTHAENGGFDRAGFGKLSPDERLYYSVSALDLDVRNGGMHLYFSNRSAELFEEAVAALKALRANHTLDLLLRALAELVNAYRQSFGQLAVPMHLYAVLDISYQAA